MSFTITNVRDHVRQFARNAGDSTMYTDAMIDRAVQAVGNRFIRVTGATRTLSTLSLTASSNALPSLPTDFRPQRFRNAWLELSTVAKGTLTRFDLSSVLQKQFDAPQTALPTMIAFSSWTAGILYPTPDQAYDLKMSWVSPFTSWTPGQTPNPNSFNLPDDWLIEILTYGVPAALQGNEPEHKYAQDNWQKYLEFEKTFSNEGDLVGVASIAEMES